MDGEFWVVKKSYSTRDRERVIAGMIEAIQNLPTDQDVFVQIKSGKRAYTPAQHSAIWKYCAMVAEALSERGVTLSVLLDSMRKGSEIEVTKENVKYQMWAPVQKALFNEASMKVLKSDQVTQVYEHINRFLAQTHGVHVPFPSRELM